MDTRIIADLATIRRLAEDIMLLDDEFSTNTADAKEIFDMVTTLIDILETEDIHETN